MINGPSSILTWVINLFNPPPLTSMTFAQKVGRVFLLTSTLVIGSILVAMLGAVGLYLMERGREMGSAPEFLNGLCIIAIGVAVNAACVLILVHLKKADHHLVPPIRPSGTQPIVIVNVETEPPRSPEARAKRTESSTGPG